MTYEKRRKHFCNFAANTGLALRSHGYLLPNTIGGVRFLCCVFTNGDAIPRYPGEVDVFKT
jgi:hypothetical protein